MRRYERDRHEIETEISMGCDFYQIEKEFVRDRLDQKEATTATPDCWKENKTAETTAGDAAGASDSGGETEKTRESRVRFRETNQTRDRGGHASPLRLGFRQWRLRYHAMVMAISGSSSMVDGGQEDHH